jgi:ribonucleotide reductase alpha subunit
VLAPTGTIGLAMDCDTTGIEPDLALVKFKKLVGGGSMQIVNQTVPRALDRLGYQAEQVEAIVEFVGEHGHVVDAPGPAARALRGVRLRDGRPVDRPDGARADDGRRCSRSCPGRSRRR